MTERNPKPSKADRTVAAREQARALREAQKKKERRNKLLIRWGVVVAVVAIIVVVALIVINSMRSGNGAEAETGPAPANANEYGGITLTSTTELEPTEPFDVDVAALPEPPAEAADDAPVPPGIAAAAEGEPVPIVVYVDVNCVHCAEFEEAYESKIGSWLDAGEVTFEYRTVAFLDRSSPSNYSSRGANAAACVADTNPASYWDFMNAIFANYDNGEIKNAELADMAESVGAGDASECIQNNGFRAFVKYADRLARVDQISGTPTVYVNGAETNANDFETAVQTAIDAAK
ncbi:thioredoxin domain-containing protein [Arthrobacter sp. zg-Y820]|uniref:DsbA family protein n=1 Tax=unclassified Arthrobacter TaxID=235627 RepID=UPI001E527498|nr:MULTISPECIES: thioredoxin domain-containing protein [unclassified Arthrobacter]MCC9198549.1 DsbA family protein [Arthrobacter sp. zg-Y820]MDK1281419.1 thioredoxin domain-containing protein [Arthrobacter sp. zg.Y820]MDK1361879.1 thioredoxin domain-containing protein [Arthrobacter sp. zg-Y1219]WIB09861.1 thioredoxin domain-containing protein [Arthrobacter sp. zg-Y820]